MLISKYNNGYHTRDPRRIRVEKPHIVILQLVQATPRADLVLSRDLVQAGDRAPEDAVANNSFVHALHAVRVDLSTLWRESNLQRDLPLAFTANNVRGQLRGIALGA